MRLYHVTTEKKARLYRECHAIRAPVRGFTTLLAATVWAMRVGRRVILLIECPEPARCHKLPDHHNKWGEAWWYDGDITDWRCVVSPKDA